CEQGVNAYGPPGNRMALDAALLILTGDGRRIHDLIAGTVVVDASPAGSVLLSHGATGHVIGVTHGAPCVTSITRADPWRKRVAGLHQCVQIILPCGSPSKDHCR